MSAAGTQTPTPGSLLSTLLGQLGVDAINALSVPLNNFFTAIEASPTQTNLIAQAMLLVAAAPLSLPMMEATAIQQAGTIGKQLVAALAAQGKAAIGG